MLTLSSSDTLCLQFSGAFLPALEFNTRGTWNRIPPNVSIVPHPFTPVRPGLSPDLKLSCIDAQWWWSQRVERDYLSERYPDFPLNCFPVFTQEMDKREMPWGELEGVFEEWPRMTINEKRCEFLRQWEETYDRYQERKVMVWYYANNVFVGIISYLNDDPEEAVGGNVLPLGDRRLLKSIGFLNEPILVESGFVDNKQFFIFDTLFLAGVHPFNLHFICTAAKNLLFNAGNRLFLYNQESNKWAIHKIPLDSCGEFSSDIQVCSDGRDVFAFGASQQSSDRNMMFYQVVKIAMNDLRQP
jgi:hypothetical protein